MPASSVSRSATPVTLLNADAARRAVIVANTDAQILYILIAGSGTVSATNFSASVAAGAAFTVPAGLTGERITGLWASTGSGAAILTTA